MALSIGGSKNKSKESSKTNQTQTNTLSDRAAGLISGQTAQLGGMSYNKLDPNAYQDYANPYQQDVIDASLAQANQADLQAQNAFKADVAQAGAFGDKRRGIYEAELMGNQSRDRATMLAGLNDRNFSQATGIAQGENANSNQFALQIQELIARLNGQFGNEGTQTMNGTSSGKSSGFNIGGSFKYGGG